jgi:hypothetical protein
MTQQDQAACLQQQQANNVTNLGQGCDWSGACIVVEVMPQIINSAGSSSIPGAAGKRCVCVSTGRRM